MCGPMAVDQRLRISVSSSVPDIAAVVRAILMVFYLFLILNKTAEFWGTGLMR